MFPLNYLVIIIVCLTICHNIVSVCSFPLSIANTSTIDNQTTLDLTKLDNIKYVTHNDVLRISFSHRGEVSSGYTFALTPSHNDIISITDKHCKTESGDEVLVIKKRDGYYSLTTVKKMTNTECSFNIRAFFVINNPTYKLSLTSSLFAPLTLDWSVDMYEGNLEVKVIPAITTPGVVPDTFTSTSKLRIKLNAKNEFIRGRYIPLLLSFNVEKSSYDKLGYRDLQDMNRFGTFFGDCVDLNATGSTYEIVTRIHTLDMGKYVDIPNLNVLVMVQVLDTGGSSTESIDTLECEATMRHTLAADITVELVTEEIANYQYINDVSPSNFAHSQQNNNDNEIETKKRSLNTDIDGYDVDNVNSKINKFRQFFNVLNTDPQTVKDMSHYTGSFGRLYMKPYHQELHPLHPYLTTVEGKVYGKNVYSEFIINVGGAYASCVLLQGLLSSIDEVADVQESNHIYRGLEGTYDSDKDQWKITSDLTDSHHTFMLYSTSTIDLAEVTWGNCTGGDVDIKMYDVNYPYHPSNPTVEELTTAKIKAFTPSPMTSDNPITVELESVVGVDELKVEIHTPYKIPDLAVSQIYSLCKAYSTTDKSLIEADHDYYFKRYILNNVQLSSTGLLRLSFSEFTHSEFIICKVYSEFVNYEANLDIVDFNGLNGRVLFNSKRIQVAPDNVEFHLVEDPHQTQDFTVQMLRDYTGDKDSSPELSSTGIDTHFLITADTNPSLTFKKGELKKQGYYSIFKNILVDLQKTRDSDDVFFDLSYSNPVKPFDSCFLVSSNTGNIHSLVYSNDPDQKIFTIDFTIKNHPDAITAYKLGKTTVTIDFTLYMIKPESSKTSLYKDFSYTLFSLNSLSRGLIVKESFPAFLNTNLYTSQTPGTGEYLANRDELMKMHLTFPSQLESATYQVRVRTKTPLSVIRLNVVNAYSSLTPSLFMDFITNIRITTNIAPEVDIVSHYIVSEGGTITITLFNQVEEYDIEKDINVYITTLINIVSIQLYITDITGQVIVNKNTYDGVGGVAYVIAIPTVLTLASHIDTSNLDFKYVGQSEQPRRDVRIRNIWTKFYNLDQEFSDYNIFKSDLNMGSGLNNIIKLDNNNQLDFPIYSIPTQAGIDVDVSLYMKPNEDNPINYAFITYVYIPDMSAISDIVRVDQNQNLITNMTISNDDYIAFAFNGKFYNTHSTLILDINEVPLKIKQCSAEPQSLISVDLKPAQPKIIFQRDLSVNSFDYVDFSVICEFSLLSHAELREGRYTGVLSASLEASALGQSTVTFVTQSYSFIVADDEPLKEKVIIDTQVTVIDTPPTGLTPEELDKIKDMYEKSKEAVTGSGGGEVVSVSGTDTYEVGDGKYNTDVDIVISPSEIGSDLDLSLDDVHDINDQFVSDIKDSYEITVSPPTYNIDVINPCETKCGVGCRLCANGKSCKVDGDCISQYCESETKKCTKLPTDDEDGDGDGDGDGGDDGGKDNATNYFVVNIHVLLCLMLSVFIIF